MVSKQQVVSFMRKRGDSARADEAEQDLPDELELPRDEEHLLRYGVDPKDLDGDEPDPG